MMQETLRKFMEREVKPLVERGEREHRFPPELVPLLAKHDLLGLKYPVEEGGQGLDIIAECIFVEELTRIAAGASAGVFAHTHLGIAPIINFGTEELREQFARPALRGELLAGFALSEPSAGSDVKGIRTRAVRDGETYRINGQKVFTTNGTIADYLIVAAYTRPGEGANGISIFVVPTSLPGVERRPLRKLGNLSSDTAEVFFTDVVVPASYRIGPEEGGFRQLMRTLTEGRIVVSMRGLALAEVAYEHALRYAKEREAFGHTIGTYQAVGHRIAQMSVDIDAARLLIYRAAHLYMAGDECAVEASKAKYFASTLAQRVTTEALHIHGGWGYTTEFEVERLYRDAPESVIGEGTAEIQLRIIAHSLGLA
jgi:alkylation response protein AidB-like acyl-CoA dehydrogenase